MINLSSVVSTWPVKDGWSIAPANVPWIEEGYKIKVGNDCRIGNDCQIGNGCRIGNDCQIGNGCLFGNGCHIGDGCQIGNGCRIGNFCRISNGCWFGEGCLFGKGCLFGNGCQIGNFCQIGNEGRVAPKTIEVIDLCVTDGWRKTLCFRSEGLPPVIGAGCRPFFTMDESLNHWGNHPEDRRATLLQIAFAEGLIALKQNRQ